MKKYNIITLVAGIITLLVGFMTEFFTDFIVFFVVIWLMIIGSVYFFKDYNPGKKDKNKTFKKYNYKEDEKSDVLGIVLFVAIVVSFGALIYYFPNKNMIQFKNNIVSNLKKYDVSNVKIENMYLAEEDYKYGYNVIIKCKSSNFKEKQIYEYIDYMQNDYTNRKNKGDNYYYVGDMVVWVNGVKYEKYYSDTLKITERGKIYSYDINTQKKIEIQETNNESSESNYTYIPFSDVDALIMAKDICEKQLKSPSSAKWESSVNITSLGNDKYSVSGNVEAKNSFGVLISTKYFAYFTFTGRGYKDGYCSILE